MMVTMMAMMVMVGLPHMRLLLLLQWHIGSLLRLFWCLIIVVVSSSLSSPALFTAASAEIATRQRQLRNVRHGVGRSDGQWYAGRDGITTRT